MSFQVPYDSSPPSTPEKSRSLMSDVSTTPAGVPPSEANSFTPAGPPPSTVYGSSMGSRSKLNASGGSLFTKSGGMNNDSIFGSSVASSNFGASQPKKAVPKFAPQSSISMPNGTLFGKSSLFNESNFTGSQMSEGPEEEYEDEEMEEEQDADGDMDMESSNRDSEHRFSFLDSRLDDSLPPRPSAALGHRKLVYSNPSHAKRPKLDEKWTNQSPLPKGKLGPKKDTAIASIVKNLASRSRLAPVDDPSEMIIQTEDEICRMYDEFRQAEYRGIDPDSTLSDITNNLVTIWKYSTERPGTTRSFGTGATIGPGEHAPNVMKAAFLASLLLQLHHPPVKSAFSSSGRAGPRSLVLAGARSYSPTPMPRVLLDWLHNSHVSATADLAALKDLEPNPTASSNFWEIINTGVLRGQFSEVGEVLRAADFNYARSSLEDGLAQAGYRGTQLQNIQRCINKALQILESCPGRIDNWDVMGVEWAMYRKQIASAITDLEEFAEGEEQPVDDAPTGNRFQAVNFGLSSGPQQNFSFAQSARMAESRVPWAIYHNLKSVYRIILGDVEIITSQAQDWVEATVGLTVWWDGEDGAVPTYEFNASGSNFRQSRTQKQTKRADSDSRAAYLERLDLAYRSTTTGKSDDTGFRVNSLSSLEVGLASVFEGNVEGVLELLQTWSLCVASAVADVSSAGGWLNAGLPGLNETDLMVLSYGQNDNAGSRVSRDDVLSAYASGLAERPSIEDQAGARGGWEVALGILSRMDDTDRMKRSVSELLDKLPLDSSQQMDKVVVLCGELGLNDEGRRVAERYGDLTVSRSEDYGLVLISYARAHNRRKVKSVVDLLISYSLVQSRAYPAFSDLDDNLKSLVTEPKTTLSVVASVDEEAASILQFYFSGYATLRRYYEIRDEAINLKDGQWPHFKPLARRRAAAQALVAVIGSAADSIYGGLYDPDRDSAVQVDGLLALLGEALVFLNQPTPILSVSDQFTILSAIEDLETVTPRVYSQCEECFRSTLLEYHSRTGNKSASETLARPPSPQALLKKSVSSLTASSSFSFIGSDMLESARTRSVSGAGSGSNSAVLVSHGKGEAVQRGWDWRAGLPEEAKAEDVLKMLRLGLARGVSFGGSGRYLM